ncbi:unnamed protein product [Adineta steineri]|uniref:K Homology domain-containing protein n=1 Tax=Adineta steineri TaxID=433720 RepID=A0A814GP67_9BILA|nr:unnamed protein product [Adineta steineri]CAF0998889.1 unnamed protein product [Adineta steineri]
MLISPAPTQILTIQQNAQIDATSELQDISRVTSSSPGSVQTDPALVDKPEYLMQLLKDKKQLAVLPNMFIHVERLLEQEIAKVRSNMNTVNPRSKFSLPEPNGEKKIVHEKVAIPIAQHPEFNFVGRILGPRGMTSKQLEAETDCKIMIRGRGSMRDKQKEDMYRGKPNWEHLDEDLHVLIQCEDYENRAAVKVRRAREEIEKLLIPAINGDDYIKKKQLTELAIINGTYREPNIFQKRVHTQINQIPMGAPLILTPQINQNYFSEELQSNLYTTTHTQSVLPGVSTSFLPNNESNFLQVFTPLQPFDPMTGSIITDGTHLFEYQNQTYPILSTATGLATRTTATAANNASRHFPSISGATASTRYQPYAIPQSHLKRS